jgi:hypothetical protein
MTIVVLSRPHKFDAASWAIKKITHFDASHASIHFHGSGTFAGQPLVFEATSHGIGITHGVLWHKKNLAVHAFQTLAEADMVRASLGTMWEYLGEDYDYRGVGYFAWRLLLKRVFGKDVRAPDTTDEMFCSELVSRWYLHLYDALGREPPAVLPEETSPADLAALLDKDELFKRVPCDSLSSQTAT